MSNKRKFLIASALAVLITALSVLFEPIGGELLRMPGIIAVGITDLFLTVLLTEGDNFFRLPNGSEYVFNAIFYTPLMYFVLWVYEQTRISPR